VSIAVSPRRIGTKVERSISVPCLFCKIQVKEALPLRGRDHHECSIVVCQPPSFVKPREARAGHQCPREFAGSMAEQCGVGSINGASSPNTEITEGLREKGGKMLGHESRRYSLVEVTHH
jgi:hypothetical protein